MREDDVWPELRRRAEERRAERAHIPQDEAAVGTLPSHLRAEFVLRAELYRSDCGWGVTVRLDPEKAPPGVALVFGTPPSMQLPSREAALSVGTLLAEKMLDRPHPATPNVTWFRLHEQDVGLTPDFVAQFAPVWRDALGALGPERATWFAVETLDAACACLRVETRGLPKPAELETDPDMARRFLGAVALCLHAGLRSWPLSIPARAVRAPRFLH